MAKKVLTLYKDGKRYDFPFKEEENDIKKESTEKVAGVAAGLVTAARTAPLWVPPVVRAARSIGPRIAQAAARHMPTFRAAAQRFAQRFPKTARVGRGAGKLGAGEVAYEGIRGRLPAQHRGKLDVAAIGAAGAFGAGRGLRAIGRRVASRFARSINTGNLSKQTEDLEKGTLGTAARFARHAAKAFKSTVRQGGATIGPYKGRVPKSGYAVSPYKKLESKVPSSKFTPKRIESYMQQHKKILKPKGRFLGTWANPKDKKTYMDVSVVKPSRKAATTLARRHKQKSIYNLKTGETINVQKGILRTLGRVLRSKTAIGIGGYAAGRGAFKHPLYQKPKPIETSPLTVIPHKPGERPLSNTKKGVIGTALRGARWLASRAVVGGAGYGVGRYTTGYVGRKKMQKDGFDEELKVTPPVGHSAYRKQYGKLPGGVAQGTTPTVTKPTDSPAIATKPMGTFRFGKKAAALKASTLKDAASSAVKPEHLKDKKIITKTRSNFGAQGTEPESSPIMHPDANDLLPPRGKSPQDIANTHAKETFEDANDVARTYQMRQELAKIKRVLEFLNAKAEQQGVLTQEELQRVIEPLLQEAQRLMDVIQPELAEEPEQLPQQIIRAEEIADIKKLGNTVEKITNRVRNPEFLQALNKQGRGWHGETTEHAEAAKLGHERAGRGGPKPDKVGRRKALIPTDKPKKEALKTGAVNAIRRGLDTISDGLGDILADYGTDAFLLLAGGILAKYLGGKGTRQIAGEGLGSIARMVTAFAGLRRIKFAAPVLLMAAPVLRALGRKIKRIRPKTPKVKSR